MLKFVKETFSIIVIRCKTVESHSGRQLYSSSFWPLDVLASMKLRYFSAYFSKSMCKYWGKGGGGAGRRTDMHQLAAHWFLSIQ